IAVSNGGLVAMFDLMTGRRVWDSNIGSYDNPWVAGDYIFMVTHESELICLERDSGRVYWVLSLPRHVDNNIQKAAIIWTGPLLAGDRLIVAGSHGRALAVSPYTGQVVGVEKMPSGVTVSPVIAGKTVY